MHRRSFVSGLTALAAAGCGGAVGPVSARAGSSASVRARLDALGERYQTLMVQHGTHEWQRYAGKLVEGPAAQAAMERLRRQEVELFEQARRALRDAPAGSVAPRQVELWRAGATGLTLLGDPEQSRLADELEAVISNHRFEHDGKEVTRKELMQMRRSPDAAVRRLTRTIEHGLHLEAAPIARRLLQRRRALARSLGLESFHAALLRVRGVDRHAEAELARADRGTRRSMARLRARMRDVVGGSAAPWDVDFALDALTTPPPDERFPAESTLDSAFAFYRALGIDLKTPPIDVTVREFAFGGQAIGVRIPSDVRLVIRPMPGARFTTTVLHELGHAFAMTRTEVDHAITAGYEWVPGLMDPAYAEGVAEVFGRMFDVSEVLTKHFGLMRDEARQLIAQRRLMTLVSVRRSLASVAIERALHDDPDADLDRVSLDLERRYGPTRLPRDAEPVWATSPFLATYPAYTQSYLLAAMVAVQVRDALRARFGRRWLGPDGGVHLQSRLVADGARWTLREKLVRCTGRPLDAGPLLRFIAR